MKKLIALLLAIFVLALFSGCGGSVSTTESTAAPTAKPTSAATAAPTQAPVVEETSPYNFAAGKYKVDERGVPTEKYTYELPLTTSDEVFTYWKSPMLPDQVDANNYGDMPYPAALRDKTGVHLEYQVVSSATKRENFAVLVASDNIPDLTSNYSSVYPGTMQNSIDDGYSANLYDYKDYMPNYYYCIWDHEDDPNVRATLMADDTTIYTMQCLNHERVNSYGLAARGDWMDKLGIKTDDVVTLDDLHDLIAAFQSQLKVKHPYVLWNILDAHRYMNCFDTLCSYSATVAPTLVVDGQVRFACSGENDRKYMSTMNSWYNEGFINPNWRSWGSNQVIASELQLNQLGVASMLPSEATGYVDTTATPGAYWTALHEPVLYEGQVFHLGDSASWLQGIGNWGISARCENIPLLVTYADWFYSDEGCFFSNYGVEGYTFFYNEKGEPQLTDFILQNPGGASWAILQFAFCDVHEAGILIRTRSFAFPGGEKLHAWYQVWDNPEFYIYDGSMAYPTAINMEADDKNRLSSIGADIQTYIQEFYLQFVDNSKPMSEWDSYVDELTHMTGWDEALAIYQKYYDIFQARFKKA